MGPMTGAELRDLRESKGITLEQAAEATCLRVGFLREMEEAADYEAIPEVYQKLSFRMYARFLGIEMETTRRAVRSESRKSRINIMPVTNFVRRMGRPPKPPVLDRQQRNRLLTVAKTTSAAVVVVLAVGLYSLNAKLARLNIDERDEETAARHLPAEPRPQLTLLSTQSSPVPDIVLEDPYPLTLVPGAGVPATPGDTE
jgi:cytoskeletal protein RodZ